MLFPSRRAPRAPAFTPSTSLFPSPPPHSALTTTRPRRLASRPLSPPRRRRTTALFIWSNDYEGDHEESDESDTSEQPHVHEEKENFWADAWRRNRSRSDVQGALYKAITKHTNGPDDVDGLSTLTSESALDAFRRIVIGILGSIPTDTYEVVISSDRAGVSKLMQSSLSTGYALRNAEFRMILNQTMAAAHAAKDVENPISHDLFTCHPDPDYNTSVSRRGRVDSGAVTGAVRWWDTERETKQQMTAVDYVALLEAENELLRERLAARQLHDANNNKLMDFMRTLNPQKIAALQSSLSLDAGDAFKNVITTVLGELSPTKVQITYSTTRDYLAQLTFWCLLVGYCIRNVEKRLEMTRIFADNEKQPSLRDVDAMQ